MGEEVHDERPTLEGEAVTETSGANLDVVVVLEQTLGHVTHGKNLQRLLPDVPGITPTFVPIPYEVSPGLGRIPGFGNWTLRAGIRTRRAVARLLRSRTGRPDAMFVHTQVPAVLLGRAMRTVPTVVSLDATPVQYDQLGDHYGHDVGPGWVEGVKTSMNRRCFERAAGLVTWAGWTKQSLVDDYGIDPERITVITPGVDTERWVRTDERFEDGVVRILFVGGDLRRKGGHHLLDAFDEIRTEFGDSVELHLVTTSDVDVAAGVTVHRMSSNSQPLIDLYHRSDIFCLPTLGDCLPMVLAEAGAAELALISTDVGAIGEMVRDGETGLLVPVSDVPALSEALRRLVVDEELRHELGKNALRLVKSEHDAARNAARLAAVVRASAGN